MQLLMSKIIKHDNNLYSFQYAWEGQNRFTIVTCESLDHANACQNELKEMHHKLNTPDWVSRMCKSREEILKEI